MISVIICRSLAHRLGRRFGSKDTLRPASRMRVINSNDICRADSDSAGGMPVACRCRALSNSGTIECGDRWLAAEPRRKYSTTGSLPSSVRDLS
ncbi:hypothetical protein D3C76_1246740 [compost metagenome]